MLKTSLKSKRFKIVFIYNDRASRRTEHLAAKPEPQIINYHYDIRFVVRTLFIPAWNAKQFLRIIFSTRTARTVTRRGNSIRRSVLAFLQSTKTRRVTCPGIILNRISRAFRRRFIRNRSENSRVLPAGPSNLYVRLFVTGAVAYTVHYFIYVIIYLRRKKKKKIIRKEKKNH